MAITFQTLVMNSGSWFRASAMTTMNKKPTRCKIVLKSLNFIVFLFRSTCFGHSCAHHQEPPNSAHTASSHRVSLGWLYLPALVCHYCCESAHHQEPPNSAHTASSHRVSLGWLYLPALVCHYCCE